MSAGQALATTATSAVGTAEMRTLAERINAEHEQCATALRSGLHHALEAGRLLLEAKGAVPHGGWLPWLKETCTVPERTAQMYMRLARDLPGRLDAGTSATVADLGVREAVALLTTPRAGEDDAARGTPQPGPDRAAPPQMAGRDADKVAVDQQAPAVEGVLADRRDDEDGVVQRMLGPLPNEESDVDADGGGDAVSLEDWHRLSCEEQRAVLAQRDPGARLNKQSTAGIEWARWSWNPVTGCRHSCSYCFARDFAHRLQALGQPAYAHGFAPALQASRLDAPTATRVPARAADDVALKNVFTCSMADLFGKWVPREWIEAVLEHVRANPQWNFLFLTKFPLRLAEFEFPDNAWLGTSVDAQARIPNAEKAFARLNGGIKWLSCEPMLERLTFSRLDLFDWVVIGGASRSTQTPEFRPPFEWVAHLVAQCDATGCEVYMKDNLLERVRRYPGQPPAEPIDVPAAFKMDYLQRDRRGAG